MRRAGKLTSWVRGFIRRGRREFLKFRVGCKGDEFGIVGGELREVCGSESDGDGFLQVTQRVLFVTHF